ncbi:Poly(A)-specific ribonuclease PARN [Chionoecetes opilio]|uniref:Poly(A)-specific ribonuclease PARN n=1 Tax=Chionoecetes opilio TaxID=41210 RepID=A0A8J5D063_CHIOP|nr:Poly(A)-specific ribonuclease PARN [Chionoecetes opilio]
MEVTTENFQEVYPSILEVVKKADFVAIDAEFTGLRRKETSRYCELDSVEERYAKVREAAKDFGMIQFGITTFRYIKEKTSYSHATFCFYLLGKTGDMLYYDNSSLKFLADNGFDFNKLFKSGLPYLSILEEAEKRAEFVSQALEPFPPSPVKVAEEKAKKFLKETEEKIEALLADEGREALVLPGATLPGFFRKLLYNNIAAKHKNILVRSLVTNHERNIEIRKFESPEARLKFLEKERERKLDEKVGFTHIVRHVLESGKPVVGHNMVLDLMHLMEKTVQPLPDTLDQFKNVVKANLPTIYDTKLLAKDPPFCVDIPVTSLGILYSELCSKFSPPEFIAEKGYASHSLGGGGQAHDAGYDAFMTGVCFIAMVKKLDGSNWKNKSVVKSKHLHQYSNRLNNMNSHDIPFLNLVGPDVQTDRSRIYCVDCPGEWNVGNVHQLFHMMKPIKIVWVSSTFIYVIPPEDTDIKACKRYLKDIQASCSPMVRVRLFGDTLAVKRKSQSDDAPPGLEPTASRVHEFKRLKSVGSDQLSKMTLESPSKEELPPYMLRTMVRKKMKADPEPAFDGTFAIPDEWWLALHILENPDGWLSPVGDTGWIFIVHL